MGLQVPQSKKGDHLLTPSIPMKEIFFIELIYFMLFSGPLGFKSSLCIAGKNAFSLLMEMISWQLFAFSDDIKVLDTNMSYLFTK